jgi:hypothetical protein
MCEAIKNKDAEVLDIDSGLHYVPVEGGWMPEELVREKTEKWYAITVWLPGSSGGNWRTDRNNITSKDEAIAIAARDFEGKKRRVVEMPNREVVAEWTYRSQGGRTVAERIKALVAVDLHGTIADKNEQHSGEYDPSAYDLQPGAVEALKELRDDGHEVVIWTCWATDEARKWLDANGVPYDYVNEEAPDHGSPKIDADLYLDDKAIRHEGDWNRTLAEAYATGKLDKGLCVITRPRGTKVDDVYQALRREGYSEESAARIAQAQTGQALATGKPPQKSTCPDCGLEKARDPKDLQEFAAEVNRIARGAPRSAKFGDKVYIGYVEYEYSIPGFRQMLLDAHRAGLVRLARFDMSYVADQRDVRASEMYGDTGVGTYHFVVPKSLDKQAMEVQCPGCKGQGCSICGGNGVVQVADDKAAGGTIMPEGMTHTGLENAKRMRWIGKSKHGGAVYRRVK